VLQPLLVQRRDGHCRLIAGHKRRRAAILAGVRRVPCTLHEVDDQEARALEAAANIRPSLDDTRPAGVDTAGDVARSLETLSLCATMVSGRPSDLSRGISADLMSAEAWRAFCIVEATRIAASGVPASRRLVAPRSVVDRIERSFQAECRLRNVAMEVVSEIPDGRLVLADEHQLVIGLSAAVITTMALFDRNGHATLRLSASAGGTGQASFVVAQNAAGVSDAWASRAFDRDWTDRPGGAPAAASMLALKRVAEASGGTAAVACTRRGTTITLTVPMA
jgi:hypothetical protein